MRGGRVPGVGEQQCARLDFRAEDGGAGPGLRCTLLTWTSFAVCDARAAVLGALAGSKERLGVANAWVRSDAVELVWERTNIAPFLSGGTGVTYEGYEVWGGWARCLGQKSDNESHLTPFPPPSQLPAGPSHFRQPGSPLNPIDCPSAL
jgi:hypothetical protein